MYLKVPEQYKGSIIRSVSNEITGSPNAIVQETVKQGKTSQPTFILGFMFTETTGTKQNDAIIKATVDSTDLISQSVIDFLDQAATPISRIPRCIPVYTNLDTGLQFKLGHLSGATLSVIRYTTIFIYTNDKNNLVVG